LWCEAWRVGISPHKVVVSLRTNVSDGGIDAHVDGLPTTDSLLVKGKSFFQVKAGHAFKPWQKSNLLWELFGNSKALPNVKTLAPAVRECIQVQGRYIIVTFGHDLTPQQHITAVDNIKSLLEGCGYKEPKVDVLGQAQLLGLMARFPSLILSLMGKGDLPFYSLDTWRSRSDMTQRLCVAQAQSNLIEAIRNTLRESTFQHIRVIGEPGVGKTRLVLEALSTEYLASSVVYVPHAEDFQDSRLFNEFLRGDVGYSVLLVVDECTERDRASIWSALKGKLNIRLVTIDHGPERSSDGGMLVLECPPLPEEQVKAIIESYLPKGTNTTRWSEWCEGSPRVAHAVGENLQRTPEDVLSSPATVQLWERFVAGYQRLDTRPAQEALTVLRYVALFQRFGFEDPVSEEGVFISRLVQEADPAITWPRFQDIVQNLRGRRILQGRRTLFIVPKALQIHLWIDYWKNYGRGFDFESFFTNLPSGLRHWFLQLFIYAHADSVAQDVVQNIVSPIGPFAKREFLLSEAGTRFLSYLAEADATGTLAVIERSFSDWSDEELRAWVTGRQNIVWALEKIVVWREHFIRAANILIRLSLTETSTFSNNSTGILTSLFTVGLGWAATQAPPQERYPLIEGLLDSEVEARKFLGLQLCKSWLDTYGGFRIVGAEYQGMRKEIEFWKPKKWGEVFDAWRLVWRHLFTISRNWSVGQRCLANNALIETGARLIHYADVSHEVMDTMFKIVDDPATDVAHLTRMVIQELKIRTGKMPRGIMARLHKLDAKITGDSFWERFARYVLNTSWDEDYTVQNGGVKDLKTPSKRVQKLAAEAGREQQVFFEHLPRLVRVDGYRLAEFGQNICPIIHSREIMDALITEQLSAISEKKTQFIGGYFQGLKVFSVEEWEAAMDSLISDEQTREVAAEIVFWSGFSEGVLRRLLDLYRAEKVPAFVFQRLAWQASVDNVPASLVEQVVAALVQSEKDDDLMQAIELTSHYFLNRDQPRSCNEDLLFSLITAKTFFQNHLNVSIGHEWHLVADGFLKRFPTRDVELFAVIVPRLEALSSITSMRYHSQIADEIAREHSEQVWPIISALLESDSINCFWVLQWLGNELGFGEEGKSGAIMFFAPDLIMRWVSKNPSKHAYKLVHCLPKTLSETEGGMLTRRFMEEYGDDERLAGSVMVHFFVGGWTGPESIYLQGKRDRARRWISETTSPKALSWIYRYIDALNKKITQAEIEEERRF
jgi:hypothetical protein